MFATTPFSRVLRNGTFTGKRMRRETETTSKPARSSTLATSFGDTQLRIGLRGFRRRISARRMIGTPELAVGVDDDAAALVGHLRDVVEDRQQIVGEGNEIREEDVVELLGSCEILGRSLNELELRMPVCRSLDHRAADVDADAPGRLDRRQQVARAAAELEHRGIPGDEEARKRLDETVIRAGAPAPALLLRRDRVEECLDLREVALARPTLGEASTTADGDGVSRLTS